MRSALRTAGLLSFSLYMVMTVVTLFSSVTMAEDSNAPAAAVTPAAAAPAAPAAATPAAPAATEESLWDYYWLGGIFMHPILACSVFSLYLLIDIILLTLRKKMVPPEALAKIKVLMEQKKIEEVIALCDGTKSIFTRILSAGLRAYPRGKTAMEETLAEYDVREASGIRVRVAYLNTMATVAPMLGLLGTVSGMVKAFANVGAMGMQASALAANIAEALITTYAGLVVAIPTMMLFFYFRNLVNDRMVLVQDAIAEVIMELEN